MRIVDTVERARPARAIRAIGIVCVVGAWMLLATAARAQSGAAQNEAAQSALAQNESAQDAPAQDQAVQQRLGVSRPDPSPIAVTPYSDSDATAGSASSSAAVPQPMQPAKPSAAVPAAQAVAAEATDSSAPTVPSSKADAQTDPAPGTTQANANGAGAAAFDPDASIVTEQTAGRAQRQLLSEAENAVAQGNPDEGIVTHVPAPPGEVPDGTLVKVKLREDLSTLTTKPGTSFTAEVCEQVTRDGQVVVPVGALMTGRVTWVRGGKRLGGAAGIHLEPSTVTLPDGSQYALRARAIDTGNWDDTRVDSEGTILRRDHAKGTAEAIGLAAGGGLAAGAEIGGLPGAVIGAGVGAGTGTAVWLKQDRQAELPKDLQIVFSLTEPMRIAPLSTSARLAQPAMANTAAE